MDADNHYLFMIYYPISISQEILLRGFLESRKNLFQNLITKQSNESNLWHYMHNDVWNTFWISNYTICCVTLTCTQLLLNSYFHISVRSSSKQSNLTYYKVSECFRIAWKHRRNVVLLLLIKSALWTNGWKEFGVKIQITISYYLIILLS